MSAPMKKSPIVVRRMDFEFADVPRYWFNGDVLVTMLMNAMSVTFPEGERFFIESVRAFRDQISDPVLQKEIGAFIGQEAMHSKEHNSFNRYLEGLGFNIAEIEAQVLRNINRTREICTPEVKLAITCALEHFTAIMAEQFLSHPEMMDTVDPKMRDLWAWHAIEETEHKSVAFDVFQQLVGDEAMRKRVMRRVTFFFIYRNTKFMSRLLLEDGQLFKPSVWYKGIKTLFGKRGLYRGMLANYLEYYQPGFHPWQRDTRALVDTWKQKLGLDQAAVPATPAPVAAEPIVVTEAAAKPARKPRAKKPVEAVLDTAPKPKRAPRRKADPEPEPQLH